MEFRWIALIALWTLLSGPAFDLPSADKRPRQEQAELAHKTPPPTQPAIQE